MEPTRQPATPAPTEQETPPEAANLPPGEQVVFEGNNEPDVHTPEYLEAPGTETEAIPGEDAPHLNAGRKGKTEQKE